MSRWGLILFLIVGLCFGALEANAQRKSRFREGSEVRGARKSSPRKQRVVPIKGLHNVVKEEGRNVVYNKRNVVDFDDSLIEGEVRNPSEFYFVHRPEEQFGSLVKKRKNFHKEMLRDSVMIR